MTSTGSRPSRPPTRAGPLAGVRVVDLSIAATGPYAAALLADQGAEVDQGRATRHRRPGPLGRHVAQRRQRAVRELQPGQAVDRGRHPHRPTGVDVVRRLAAEADVLVQNYRPGVVDRVGLGYDDLRRGEPRPGLRVALGLRPDRPLRRQVGLRHGDPGLRRAGQRPGRTRTGEPVFLRQTAADKVTALDRERRPSPPRCSPASAAPVASTSSCRCSTPSCRSSGSTRPATRC